MISAVSEMYNLHPQTLRLYEREGLLSPSRSDGNTRLYTEQDLERLEVILSLTRDLGVNLAGIEIILNMRERMTEMEREMKALVEFMRRELSTQFTDNGPRIETALVRVGRPHIVRTRPAHGR
jgi:MerR family transcriptional regulator/heat shock protein HspR